MMRTIILFINVYQFFYLNLMSCDVFCGIYVTVIPLLPFNPHISHHCDIFLSKNCTAVLGEQYCKWYHMQNSYGPPGIWPLAFPSGIGPLYYNPQPIEYFGRTLPLLQSPPEGDHGIGVGCAFEGVIQGANN
ncbi:MAG: hypothetical protein J6Q08_05230, partial [Bacteroidaceae bacterium]|nr:hypothetical protein [Bacteroidaceae bacterium]